MLGALWCVVVFYRQSVASRGQPRTKQRTVAGVALAGQPKESRPGGGSELDRQEAPQGDEQAQASQDAASRALAAPTRLEDVRSGSPWPPPGDPTSFVVFPLSPVSPGPLGLQSLRTLNEPPSRAVFPLLFAGESGRSSRLGAPAPPLHPRGCSSTSAAHAWQFAEPPGQRCGDQFSTERRLALRVLLTPPG